MGSKRRRPKQARSQFTVDAILDAVSHVIRDQGASAITTNRIAERAGVSIGSLYQYFSNKQDILNALHARHFRTMAQQVEEILHATEDGSLDDLLVALVDLVIRQRQEDPEMHRLLATTVPRNAATLGEVERLSDAFLTAISMHRDELSEDTALDRLAFVLRHMIVGLANATVLFRPRSLSLEDARTSSLAALRAVVDTERGP